MGGCDFESNVPAKGSLSQRLREIFSRYIYLYTVILEYV